MLSEKIDQNKDIERQEKLLAILKNKLKAIEEIEAGFYNIENLEPTYKVKYFEYQEQIWHLKIDIETKERIISEHKNRLKQYNDNLSEDIISEVNENIKDLVKEGKQILKKMNLAPETANEMNEIIDNYYTGRFTDEKEKADQYLRLKLIISSIKAHEDLNP